MKISKLLILFLLNFILFVSIEKVYNQQPIKLAQNVKTEQTEDWSALFPEIQNCERKINPKQTNIYAIAQSAEYTRNGLLCVSISFILKLPNKEGKYEINKSNELPWMRKIKVLNFDAVKISSICGNDLSSSSIIVNVDANKSVSLTSYEYYSSVTSEPWESKKSLLEIATKINYKLMKKLMKQ